MYDDGRGSVVVAKYPQNLTAESYREIECGSCIRFNVSPLLKDWEQGRNRDKKDTLSIIIGQLRITYYREAANIRIPRKQK